MYGAFWKGKLIGKFNTEAEATTFIHLENQQMELAEYTPPQLRKHWKIRKLPSSVMGERTNKIVRDML